jgi:RNA methyltransferase, TrmH family
MISKNEIKYIKSLQLKKFRDLEKQFTAEGRNNVEEGINSSYRCTHLLLSEPYVKANPGIIEIAGVKNIRYSITGEDEFSRAAGSVNPQGILGIFDIPERKMPEFEEMNEPVVYLDEISDPGNVGTIIRTGDWFGIRHIILSSNSADIYNPKTVRATAGSLFHLNLYPDTDLISIFANIKNADYSLAATVLEGVNIYSSELVRKTIIVLSNEANGVSKEILELADQRITIPGKGKAESLNVASAAAVIMAEFARRY